MATIPEIKQNTQHRMDATIAAFKNTLTKIRTGRANPGLLDTVHGSGRMCRCISNIAGMCCGDSDRSWTVAIKAAAAHYRQIDERSIDGDAGEHGHRADHGLFQHLHAPLPPTYTSVGTGDAAIAARRLQFQNSDIERHR